MRAACFGLGIFSFATEKIFSFFLNNLDMFGRSKPGAFLTSGFIQL